VELCDSLSDVKRKQALDKMIFEYRQYMRSGSPEDCAQRKEWMKMSYEDIRKNFNNTVNALRNEVKDIRNSYTNQKPPKKQAGRQRKKTTED
ncbi:hypothetical protein, partial [[Ruminococcus] lactaris]|uniref:hypothetical protein n=1 Tax=[Ruminococcus] lactaris TaxID=46228 RepID=UPI003FD7144C